MVTVNILTQVAILKNEERFAAGVSVLLNKTSMQPVQVRGKRIAEIFRCRFLLRAN